MKVCVIGAGPSGLCAAKEITENNPEFEVTIFDQASTLGGTFAQSYAGLTLVNNPLLVSFSDFLPTDRLGNLRMWTAEEYVSYLESYARCNGVSELIRYHSFVTGVAFTGEKWHVTVSETGQTHTSIFDYLVVCCGSNNVPNIPTFKGQPDFGGRIVHSSEIKDPAELKGLRVVYVGLGETGSDLSYLSSRLALSSTVSVRRRPGYLIPRYHDGQPTDLDTSKLYHSLPKHLDNSSLAFVLRLKRKLERSSIRSVEDGVIQDEANRLNEYYADANSLGPFRRASTKSCGFIRAHLAGTVDLKPEIIYLQGSTVHFSDGTASKADVIVCCTGYKQHFAFLPADLASAIPSSNVMYEYMFPLDFSRKLAFIGFVRPGVGTVPAAAELQSRYLSLLLRGVVSLPSPPEMAASVKEQQEMSRKTFPLDFDRLPQIVDYYPYMTGLAAKMGVLPEQTRLFCTDMKLWYKVNFAFLCPGIFRLHGPGAKPDLVSPVLRALPTMRASVLILEALLYLACKVLSLAGLRRFRPIGAAR